MKAFFSLYKIGHQCQHLGRTPICSQVKVKRSVPSLVDLAVRRSLSSFVAKKSHYEVLGLTRTATVQEIRQAFLKLSKECHPDRNRSDPDTHKKFVQLNEAYSVLSKPLSRRDYDMILDAERFVARRMNSSGHHSHTYGQHHNAGHYYHHRGHFYDEGNWGQNEYYTGEQGAGGQALVNFYVVTFCVTCAAVATILHYMHNYIPNPRLNGLSKNLNKEELDKHELIMTSNHDGMIVHYYAIPKKDDPKTFEVLAVRQTKAKNSDEHELHELNEIQYSKRNAVGQQ